MTGEEILESLIVKAVAARQWPRERAERAAWAWLSKESGVTVRWEHMDVEQRWEAEAALERQALMVEYKKPKAKPRPESPLPDHLTRAMRLSHEVMSHPSKSFTPEWQSWISSLAVDLDRIEHPGMNFDLFHVA